MMKRHNTWVFLRGLARESQHWGRFLATFKEALPDSEVIALDLPGNGRLHQQRSPLSIQALVEFCRAELAARQIEPPYQLLAMSLGGMVSVAWAQTYPQELAAQVLINTSMRPFSPFYQRLLPENYPKLIKLLLTGARAETWERTILQTTSNHPIEEVLPCWLALREVHPVSNTNALRQLIAAARFSAHHQAPSTPTLVLASALDRLVAVACSQHLARQWGCPLQLHPSAGHDLTLDDGPWVAAQVRAWQLTLSTPQ